MAATYPTKKALKAAVGDALRFEETSLFGAEYKSTGTFCVVGPSEFERKWFAKVTMEDNQIVKVT